jgi:hypothetical protein
VRPAPTSKEEEVAPGAFDSVIRRAERGPFARLEYRDDLGKLLAVLTVRKAANLARREGQASHGGRPWGAATPT